MLNKLRHILREENGFDGWIALIMALSFITFTMGLTFDFRHEWNKKDLFNETILSVKYDFQEEGGVTSYIEDEIINRLQDAGIETTNVTIEGSPQSNYGSKIYYMVTIDTTMKVGSENIAKTYKKKVVGTSAFVPTS